MSVLDLPRLLGRASREPLIDNDNLRAIVDTVMEGPAGDPIRLHGGTWRIAGIADNIVTLKLRGACHGCPAVSFTIGLRIETAIRELYPELVKVVAV
jgi:Fe-S cluster biogenesis protein NfuA